MSTAERLAEKGNSVTIKYSIHFNDGTQVEEKKTSKPLTFKIGFGKVFPKLEQSVIGMKLNERRTILIKAEDGYGQYNQELVMRVERKLFPGDVQLVPGRAVQYQNRDGQRVNFIVNAEDGQSVTIDGNHPLAGLDLTYVVQLLNIA